MSVDTASLVEQEKAEYQVQQAERAYQVYTEYMQPDATIIGWLNSAKRSLAQGYGPVAVARAEQVRAELYRLSVAHGLISARPVRKEQ